MKIEAYKPYGREEKGGTCRFDLNCSVCYLLLYYENLHKPSDLPPVDFSSFDQSYAPTNQIRR